MAPSVLFMFLGGVPIKEDVAEHWSALLRACPNDTLQNIWAVVHPIDQSQATLDSITKSFWGQYLGSRFLVCDKAHWVRTSWATRSLVDATLLMMQYARSFHGAFKKYILASSACCPVINLTDIVKMFVENDLSWLQGSDQGWAKPVHPVILRENGGLFEMEHLNFFSQWMALDNKHAESLFIGDRTYVVSDTVYTCTRDSVNAVNINPTLASHPAYKELQLALFSFSYDYLDPEQASPCAPADEMFFGSFVLRKLFQEGGSTASPAEMELIIRQNIRIITRKNADRLCSILRNYSNVYSTLKRISLPNQIDIPAITTSGDARFWIGQEFRLNNEGIRNKQWSYCTKSLERVRLKGVNQVIVGTPVEETCDATCYNVGQDTECIAVAGKGPQLNARYVTVSPTYCDWNAFVPDPENVLRDFRICKVLPLNPDLKWCQFNIKAYLQLSSPDLARQYLLDMDKQMEDTGLTSLQNRELPVEHVVTMPDFHPVEYSSWSLRQLANAFVLMTFLSKSFLRKQQDGTLKWPHYVFASIYTTWKRELQNAWSSQESLFDNNGNITVGFWQQTSLPDVPTYVHGITPDILTACWAAGTPFVRKCKLGCNINRFTDFIVNDTSKIAEAMNVTAHASQVNETIRIPSYARYASIGISVLQGVLLAAITTMLVLWLQAVKLKPTFLKSMYMTFALVILIAMLLTAGCLVLANTHRTDRVLKEHFNNDSKTPNDGLVLGTESAAAADLSNASIDVVHLPNNIDSGKLQQARLEIAQIMQTIVPAKDDPDHINDQQHPPADALANIEATAARRII